MADLPTGRHVGNGSHCGSARRGSGRGDGVGSGCCRGSGVAADVAGCAGRRRRVSAASSTGIAGSKAVAGPGHRALWPRHGSAGASHPRAEGQRRRGLSSLERASTSVWPTCAGAGAGRYARAAGWARVGRDSVVGLASGWSRTTAVADDHPRVTAGPAAGCLGCEELCCG